MIRVNLPELKELLLDESSKYELKCISSFDHWLSIDEANELIDIDDPVEISDRRNKFESFVR